MGFFHFEERMPKALSERSLIAEQKVWLFRNKYIVSVGEGNPFGMVLRDSLWPDKFVTVECWDREKYGHWMNTEGRRRDGLPPVPAKILKAKYASRKKKTRRIRA